MITVYKGQAYEIINRSFWGSVEIATLRAIGFMHTISVPVCNLGSV